MRASCGATSLPNMPPIIVLFTTRVGAVILAESGFAFLGLGVPPPAPTWGGMLSGSGRTYMFQGPVAGAGAGPVPDRGGLRHQRVRRRLRDLLDPRMRGHALTDPTNASQRNVRRTTNDEKETPDPIRPAAGVAALATVRGRRVGPDQAGALPGPSHRRRQSRSTAAS